MAKKNQVLALTRYQNLGASSRIRFFKYNDLLSEKGFEVTYQSLLPNEYVDSLYSGKSFSPFKLFFSYLKRFLFILFRVRGFDLIWIEKELFPGVPTLVEKLLFTIFPCCILDYDDSVHLNYKDNSFGRKNKIEKLMPLADVVFAGSPYLEEVAVSSGSSNVVKLPTPVQLLKASDFTNKSLTVGWAGSPSTEKYLLSKCEVFKKISSEVKNIKFIFVGAQSEKWKEFSNVELVPWSESSQVQALKKMNIGIMPLEDTLWEKGKCSYKLLLYMSAGIPVIASPVGMNNEVVVPGKNGLLASTDSDWISSFKKIMTMSEGEFRSMGKFSRELVEKNYTYDVTTAIVEESFLKLIKGKA